MAARGGIEVTGFAEFEGNLIQFERVVAPAEIRKGTRDAAKLINQEYRANQEEHSDSGAMRDASAVRAMKRSRVKIGHTVTILRDRLFRLYQSRKGRLPGSRAGESEPFFYPIVVELGDKDTEAEAPLRRGLYDNANAVRAEFAKSLLRAVNHPKIKTKKTIAR